MADKQVETKVVQVRFDNSKFSKNIDKTIKQCNKFDKSLQFKGSKDNIRDIQKALDEIDFKKANSELNKTEDSLHKITIGFKDFLKLKLLSKAMDVVITKSNAIIKSMLGINNVVAGWQQYETQMTNVGGILNQVQNKLKSDGTNYGLQDVADAMERLRWYTDETSYSFTTLSNGIRQFVIAGVDLNKAAEAAMGVTNLAGSAKVFDEFKIQSAMDAVSKAMQTGYMDTMKWTSLTNTAGIVTEEFSQKLLDEAFAQGKLVKSAAGQYKTKKGGKLVTTENIRSTLSDKWLTSDVLANVMDEYASASTAVETFSGLMADQTDESLSKINEMFKDSGVQFGSFDEIMTKMPNDVEDATELTAEETGRFLKELGYQFDEVSYKAFKSAQETTSFSQSITYVKKAISTQWANIFQKIFGDYDKSTELWSDISGKFYRIFVMPFENLTSVFDDWSKLTEGGAEDFRNMVRTIIDIVGKFKEAVSAGFRAVFGEMDVSWLQKMTLALKKFFEKISEGLSVLKNEAGNEKENPLFKMIKALSKILASILKIIGKIHGTVIKILGKVFVALEPVFEIVADILDMIANGLIWVINMIDELGILDYVVEGVAKALEWLANGIKSVVNWIKGKVDLEKVTKNLSKAFGYLKTAIEWIIERFKEAGIAIRDWWNENEIAQKTIDFFKTAVEKTKGTFSGFKKSTDDASESIDNLGESLENTGKIGNETSSNMSWIEKIKNIFKSIGEFFKSIGTSFVGFLQDKGILDSLIKVWEAIKSVFQPIIDMFVGWWKQLATLAKEDPTEALKTVAKAIAIIIGIFLMLKVGGIMKAGKDVLWEVYYTLKAFKKKILAERWKALASAVLILSAAVLVLSFTMEKIGEIPTAKAWKAMGIIGVTLLAFAGLLALMNAPIFKTSIKTGLSITLQMEAFAIGLALFMAALNKAIKITKGNSQGDIWKAYGLIAAISALMVLISLGLFKKVEKTGLFKGEFIKGPSTLMLLKTFLVVFGILKLTMWFIEKINEFEPDQLKTASITAGVIVGGIAIIFGVIKLLGKIMSKKTGVEKITNQWIKVNIGSLALVALASYYVLSQAASLEWDQIGRGVTVLAAIFGAISVVLLALGLMDRIASGKNAEKVGVKLGKSMLSIGLSALICVAALKMIGNVASLPEIWRGGSFILALYAVIGLIAIGLTAVSKVVKLTVGKDGVSTVGAKSPIGNLLLAISGLVLVCILALKYLEEMQWEEFKDGFTKLKWIMILVAGTASAIMIASHFANGKSIIIAMTSIGISILAIVVAMAVISDLVSKDKDSFYTAALAIGIIALVLTIIIAALIIIAAKMNSATPIWPTLVAASVLFLAIGGSILMIAGAMKMISGIPVEVFTKARDAINIIAAVIGVIVLGITAIIAFTGGLGMAAILSAAAMFLAIGGALLMIAQSMKMVSTIVETGNVWDSVNALIAMLLAFTAAVVALGLLGASGIGWVGVGLIAAIGVAAVGIAGGLWIASKATENFTNSIIKLMNEATSEKCNNLLHLAGALGALAVGTLADGLANLSASVANFGASLVDLGSNAVNFISEGFKKLGGLLGFDMRSKDEKALDILSKKVNAVEKYANALTKIKNIDEDMIADKINKISSAIIESSVGLIGSNAMDFFNRKDKVGFAAFLENLEKLKEILEDMPEPVITPILDLTEFNKGINAIKNGDYNIRAKLYDNYAPVASMPSMSSIRKQNEADLGDAVASANGFMGKANAVTINQQFLLNDQLSYSYDTQRATANAISQGNRVLETK